MRRLFLILAVILLSQTIALAQKAKIIPEQQVPERYVKDFQKRYPDVKTAQWSRVDSLVYDVTFDNSSTKEMLRFSNKGVEMRWYVDLQYAPKAIKDYIAENMPKYKLKEVCILDIRGKKTYQVEVVKKFLFFTKDVKVLNFEIDGKYIDTQEI